MQRVVCGGLYKFGVMGWHDAHLHEFRVGEETECLRTWAGLDFDPARFDRAAASAAIDRMLWNGWVK